MERKLVTVLFADAMGSTSLADRLDPERLRTVLDSYFAAMAGAVDSWGGTVEKFIGDAVMAVFGVPAVREDDAERALSAAMEMMERLEELNKELQARHGLTLRMRIGVNTGEVVTGTPSDSSQRLVSGDPVNVAARLQAEAEPDAILAGERTYLSARHSFRFGGPMDLQLKGKPETVRARRVLGKASESRRGVPGLSSPLVGRAPELQALDSLLDEVLEARRPRLVTVLGPAGVGKSRLVHEFVAGVRAQHPNARVLRGRCLAAGHGITFWALGEILRAACGIRLDDPAELALEKLKAKVPDPRTLEALAATAGIAVPGTGLEALSPQAVAEELASAWPRFASAEASADLAIWVVEDLHWAGDPLLEMLERVIARSTGPFLIIGTARPDLVDAHPGFGGGSENFSTISLRPLSSKQSQQLLEGLLTMADMPSEMTADILRKADGNPFFLEEIVRRLIEEEVLVRQDGRWHSTGSLPKTPLPDSLLALLSARIDALPDFDKRVLQEASVIGRLFWPDPLQRTLGDEVPPALLSLERRGLITATPTSSLANHSEYAFKHALVRDVAYSSLPKVRRARAHAEIAAWIEELAGGRTDEFGELLAFHYTTAAAGEDADLAWSEAERKPIREKAFTHLVAAGVQARRRFAIPRSIELHQQAVAVAAGDEERFRALVELGDDNRSGYHGDSARAAYLEALEIARRTDRSEDRARLCAKLAEMMSGSPGAFKHSPDPEPVDELIAEGLAHTADGETRARLEVAFGRASRLYSGSEPFGQGTKPDPVPLEQRIAAVERARAFGESRDVPELHWITNSALGLLYGMAGRYSDSLELAVKELPLVEQLGSRLEQGDAVRRAAIAVMDIGGRYEEALVLARRSLQLSLDTNPHQIMHGTFPVIATLFELDRWEEIPPVLAMHVQAFALDPAIECDFVRDGPILGAVVAARSGDPGRARELANLVGDPDADIDRATAWQARLAVAMGDPELARRISNGKVLEGRSYGPGHARSMLEALIAIQAWDELEALIPQARRLTGGLAVLGPCCDRAEGVLAAARGDRTAASAAFERAITGFESLHALAEATATRKMLELDPQLSR